MFNTEVKYLTYLVVVSFALSILLQVSEVTQVSTTSHSSGQPQSHSHCITVLTSSWHPHNNVELIGIRLVRTVTRQFMHDS